MNIPRLCLCLGLATLLAACSAAPDVVTRLPTPNPNPVERFKVTVEVSNAPGEFESAEGFVLFQVTDDTRSCLPRAEFSGAPLVAYAGLRMPFPLTKTSPITFEGVATLDQFVPKDDYGLGPCEWQTIGLDADLFNGINRHVVGAQLSLTGSGFEAGDDRYRLADGIYRGRSAFTLDTFNADRLLPQHPPLESGDPLPLFSGGQANPKLGEGPPPDPNRYYITITAERLEPVP